MELLDSLLAVRLANMSSFRTSGFLPGASASESLPRPGNQRAMEQKRKKRFEEARRLENMCGSTFNWSLHNNLCECDTILKTYDVHVVSHTKSS